MTKFQKKVYNIVRMIKPGRVMTYAEVARAVGKPRAYRVVGNALNKNRDPKIPCHRVIRSDGTIGDYNRGRNRKLNLLILEGVNVKIKNAKIKMTTKSCVATSLLYAI